MTLKTEIRSPSYPDWYTFHPDWTRGLFMEIVTNESGASGDDTVTLDS